MSATSRLTRFAAFRMSLIRLCSPVRWRGTSRSRRDRRPTRGTRPSGLPTAAIRGGPARRAAHCAAIPTPRIRCRVSGLRALVKSPVRDRPVISAHIAFLRLMMRRTAPQRRARHTSTRHASRTRIPARPIDTRSFSRRCPDGGRSASDCPMRAGQLFEHARPTSAMPGDGPRSSRRRCASWRGRTPDHALYVSRTATMSMRCRSASKPHG